MFDGWEEKDRVRLLCSVAGLLFGLGWWCFIDAASVARVENYEIGVTFEQYMPGFAGTIALFMVNCMDWGTLSADDFSYNDAGGVANKAKCCVIFALLISLSGIVGAVVIIAEKYQPNAGSNPPIDSVCNTETHPAAVCSMWPGIAILIQAVVLFLATFVMRIGLGTQS